MNVFTWKTIGILGGMGPEATAELYRRIITICQREYRAKYDSDFPPIFIYNLPLPDIVLESGDKEAVVRTIKDGIEKLATAGCDFIAVPCNTVFYFINSAQITVPLLNLIEETFFQAKKSNFRKVGILSTQNTAKNKLYESVFNGIEVLQPSEIEQGKINEIIMRILAGFKTNEDREYLRIICKNLEKKGAEAIILGCTELPLLVSQVDCNIEMLDTLQILAESTVKKARVDAE